MFYRRFAAPGRRDASRGEDEEPLAYWRAVGEIPVRERQVVERNPARKSQVINPHFEVCDQVRQL